MIEAILLGWLMAAAAIFAVRLVHETITRKEPKP